MSDVTEGYTEVQGKPLAEGGFERLFVHEDSLREQSEAYAKIARMAENAGLIVFAYGGVMVIAHPSEQLTQGTYHEIQKTCGVAGKLKTLERIQS